MEAPIIISASGKGKSGKTTMLLNLTNYLTTNGIRILYIDSDLEARGSTFFFQSNGLLPNPRELKNNYMVMENLLKTAHDCHFNKDGEIDTKEWNKNILKIQDNFDFIPAIAYKTSFNFPDLDVEGFTAISSYMTEKFAEWQKTYDLILIDLSGRQGRSNGLNEFFMKFCSKCLLITSLEYADVQLTKEIYDFLCREGVPSVFCRNMLAKDQIDIFKNMDEIPDIINGCTGLIKDESIKQSFEHGEFIPLEKYEDDLHRISLKFFPELKKLLTDYLHAKQIQENTKRQQQERDKQKKRFQKLKEYRTTWAKRILWYIRISITLSLITGFFSFILSNDIILGIRNMTLFIFLTLIVGVIVLKSQNKFDCVEYLMFNYSELRNNTVPRRIILNNEDNDFEDDDLDEFYVLSKDDDLDIFNSNKDDANFDEYDDFEDDSL